MSAPLRSFALLAAALLCAGPLGASPAAAQEEEESKSKPEVAEVDGRDFIGTIMLGVRNKPAYFGATDRRFGPAVDLRVDFLRLPGGLEFGSTRSVGFTQGFGLVGSARYIRPRTSSNYKEIQGLENVDRALELGFGAGYEQESWRAFGDVRYAVLGYNSWTGTLGADAISRPSDSLILNMGPRLQFGDQRFMSTYFGVTGEESVASGMAPYDPTGGLASVGVVLNAEYAFTSRWGLQAAATYDRLVGEAAGSPITERGSADQFGVMLGVTRQISLDF